MAQKKISAKSVLQDLENGLTDAALMEKYGISFQGLQTIFQKLIEHKLVTAEYFQQRSLRAVAPPRKEQNVSVCPHCGFSQKQSFTVCPRCEMNTADWLNTVELAEMLTGGLK